MEVARCGRRKLGHASVRTGTPRWLTSQHFPYVDLPGAEYRQLSRSTTSAVTIRPDPREDTDERRIQRLGQSTETLGEISAAAILMHRRPPQGFPKTMQPDVSIVWCVEPRHSRSACDVSFGSAITKSF
jgi:hypothetical protein